MELIFLSNSKHLVRGRHVVATQSGFVGAAETESSSAQFEMTVLDLDEILLRLQAEPGATAGGKAHALRRRSRDRNGVLASRERQRQREGDAAEAEVVGSDRKRRNRYSCRSIALGGERNAYVCGRNGTIRKFAAD